MKWQRLRCVKKPPSWMELRGFKVGDSQEWPLWDDNDVWNDMNDLLGISTREGQAGWTAKKVIHGLFTDGYLVDAASDTKESK